MFVRMLMLVLLLCVLLIILRLRNFAAVANPVFADVAFAVYLAAFIAGNHQALSFLNRNIRML
ncbi:hypothetical protein D3C71_2053750 [compost metagenome]